MEEQILGDYRLLKQIGHGSLGAVYLAEQRFIKRPYVLKILPSELTSDRGFIKRFEEEIGRISALEHSHIVKIHNVSFVDGRYFLVSDCVVDALGETTNLAAYMSGRRDCLAEEELLSLLTQVADALDYAHTKDGMAHLGLKLSNILMGKAERGLTVFLADFGLSKVIGAGMVVSRCFHAMAQALGMNFSSDETYSATLVETQKLSKLTASFLQSYAFLAPEQKRVEVAGIPADIYAFGVLTYFLIAGRYPEGMIELPSKIAPHYLHNWDKVVTECLQVRPERRPLKLGRLLEQIQEKQAPAPQRIVIESEVREKAPLPTPPKVEMPAPEPVLVTVTAAKSVESATPLAVNPPKNEKYEQALSSMLSREPVVTTFRPEKKEERVIEPIPTEMVVIQGGRFTHGSNDGNRDEMPSHQVVVNSFALDTHPVTNEQFVRFLDFLGGEKDQNYHDVIRLKDSRVNRIAGKLSIESGYAKHPVVGVTWYGAVAYAQWVSKRLPTEAEWEIAVRGGLEGYAYPSGETLEKSQANFFSSDTTAVMSYAPNPYGLYDMIGNVYEWCQDWYGYNYYEISAQEPNNPKGPVQGVYRVLRGGCWKSLPEDLRCAHRHRNNPGTVNGTYGFRCASDVA